MIELPEYVVSDIATQVKAALKEDVGSGDITAMLIPADSRSSGRIITREDAILCGRQWVEEVFSQLGGGVSLTWNHDDGDSVEAGDTLCDIEGNTRQILTGERNALNFLQTLSATATVAKRYSRAGRKHGITILDTRKTLPGLRTAQKYAVLCGDCKNHRLGLHDAFLIKENHIVACGSITSAIEQARKIDSSKPVIVEVENLAEFREALGSAPDQIMLDNFSLADIKTAASMAGEIQIEVSGNQDLQSIQKLDIPGICVSIGAMTKHIQAIDLSLRLDER